MTGKTGSKIQAVGRFFTRAYGMAAEFNRQNGPATNLVLMVGSVVSVPFMPEFGCVLSLSTIGGLAVVYKTSRSPTFLRKLAFIGIPAALLGTVVHTYSPRVETKPSVRQAPHMGQVIAGKTDDSGAKKTRTCVLVDPRRKGAVVLLPVSVGLK